MENEEQKPDKTGGKPILRDEKGLFIAGTATPNPAGRPKGTISVVERIKRKLAEYTTEEGKEQFIDGIVKVIIKKCIVDEDVSMIRDLVNRVDGLPKQTIGVIDESKENITSITEMIKKLDNDKQQQAYAFLESIYELNEQGDTSDTLSEGLDEIDKRTDISTEGGNEGLEVGGVTQGVEQRITE